METIPVAPQETFSQGQIEELLAHLGDVESPVIEAGPNNEKSPSIHSLLLPGREFPQLYSFSAEQLRRLRVRHEEYIRCLAGRLSAHLRLECVLQMSKLESANLEQFVDGISVPTYLTAIKLEPLNGSFLLDIPLRLGLCIVDRELGGPGKGVDELREFSKIEARVLSRVVEIIASEWCSTWKDFIDLRPTVAGHQTNASGLSVEKEGNLMLVVGIEVRIGAVVEQMVLGFPYRPLAPLLLKLDLIDDAPNEPTPQIPLCPARWNAVFDDVELKLSAHLPDVEVTARQLSDLRVGDIIPLPASALNAVQIHLASIPKFVGAAGSSGKNRAVKIEERMLAKF